MRRAARRGDGFMPYLVSAASYEARAKFIRAAAAEAGRELPDDFAWAVRLEMRLDDDVSVAVDRVAEALSWRFGKPFPASSADRYSVAGTPDRVIEKMKAYMNAGLDVFALQPVASTSDEMIRLLERFAAEVLPELRTPSREVIAR